MGIRKRKMANGAATAMEAGNVKHFPGYGVLGNETDDPAVRSPLTFWQQRAVDLGMRTMAVTPTVKPPYWNTTMVTAWCAVAGVLLVLIGMVVALWYFTWQTADAQGYYRGKDETEKRQLRERLEKAEDDAAEAKKFSVYAAAGSDAETGHKPKPKEKK